MNYKEKEYSFGIIMNKAFKLIDNVSKILTIAESIVKYAKKLYTIASNKKFTQGRNTKHRDVIISADLLQRQHGGVCCLLVCHVRIGCLENLQVIHDNKRPISC